MKPDVESTDPDFSSAVKRSHSPGRPLRSFSSQILSARWLLGFAQPAGQASTTLADPDKSEYATDAGWIEFDTPASDLFAASITPPANSDDNGIFNLWEVAHSITLTIADAEGDGDRWSHLLDHSASAYPMALASPPRIISHFYLPEFLLGSIGFNTGHQHPGRIQRSGLKKGWNHSGFGRQHHFTLIPEPLRHETLLAGASPAAATN
jgi:hypothetical protein